MNLMHNIVYLTSSTHWSLNFLSLYLCLRLTHSVYIFQWQKNEVSTVYLLYRWLLALIFLGVYITCIILQYCDGKFFIYMTNWGFGLITITMIVAAVNVTRWHYDLQNVRSLVQEAGQKARTTCGLKMYWWLYNISLLLALIISTVYWIFLNGRMSELANAIQTLNIILNYILFYSMCVDKPTRFPVISIVTHALNTVCMLIDFLVVAFPLRLWHMVQTMCMAIAFFLFTLIYHVCGGTDE